MMLLQTYFRQKNLDPLPDYPLHTSPVAQSIDNVLNAMHPHELLLEGCTLR